MIRLKIKNIETAVKIYYTAPELQNSDIMELFSCSKSAALSLKKKAKQRQEEKGILTFSSYTVNTKCAFEAWRIDISDYEKRLRQLHKLKSTGVLV